MLGTNGWRRSCGAALSLALVGPFALFAPTASACAFCAQGTGHYGPHFGLAVGLMLGLPFAIAVLVLRQVLVAVEGK